MFKKFATLIQQDLFRKIRDRTSPQGRIITINGKTFINFSSNDYLGLSNHKLIKEAVVKALQEYGTGSGASRLLSGGTELHQELERLIAKFKTTETSIIFNSGYTANIGVLPAITDKETLIFSDELNHASLIDGCRLSKAETAIYRHKDLDHLSALLKKCKKKQRLIVTDSVFSMDGDIAPLKELHEIAVMHEILLYVDDAHGTGVLGDGRGSIHHFGISSNHFIIQMATLSKAIGSFGAFIAAKKDVISYLINSARSLIYSTALPAHVIAASIMALNIIMNDRSLVMQLWENRATLVKGLHALGILTGLSETPIIPIILKSNNETLRLAEFLTNRGIYAPAIRYPTVKTPRIRLTVTAAHTEDDIYKLLEVLKEARECKLL